MTRKRNVVLSVVAAVVAMSLGQGLWAQEARFQSGTADQLLARYGRVDQAAAPARVIHAQPSAAVQRVESVVQPAAVQPAVVQVVAPRNSRAAETARVVHSPRAYVEYEQPLIVQRQTIVPASYAYGYTTYHSGAYYPTRYHSPYRVYRYDCAPVVYHRPGWGGYHRTHYPYYRRGGWCDRGWSSHVSVGFYFRF